MMKTSSPAARAAIESLRRRISGEVRDDRLARAMYATDASIYEIVPDGVVFPRRVEDVQEAVRVCAAHGVPLTARGAGTGLAGGAVNRGLQLDCSRYLNRILHVDPGARLAVVEPGVVEDELNAALRPFGLHFAPDVATSSRATIGGMIANNSCGAHSVRYGRTVDHVRALSVVLSDGSLQTWGMEADEAGGVGAIGASGRRGVVGMPFDRHQSPFGAACEKAVADVAARYADEIARRFPKVLRRNGGYALDRVRRRDGRANVETIICGSEGTLAIVVGAVLNLEPLPRFKGIVAAHFGELLDALAATPAALEHAPAAVELIDKLILDAARRNPVMRRRKWLIEGDPRGVLIIELYDDDAEALARRLRALAGDLSSRGMGYAHAVLTDPVLQEDLWYIRKSGLGLLMSTPGDRQTYDFVEDTAVDPARLRDYIARFMRVLEEEGVAEASYYAHASVGCLHVKPVLNLKSAGDIAKMHRIADRVSSLALEFGGTMTGEHGDGLLRSCWLEKMYGLRIMEAFGLVKSAFDPLGVLNPGKIVDPLPMLENFRYGPAYQAARPLTVLDFSAHGGMAGMAEMCSGVGQCRSRLVGTMCPSYMATGDEAHTTRARANALRLALSNRDIVSGLSDPVLDEVMDLCLSCKACKSECPTGVDMAKLKAEWLHQRNRREGAPLRSRLIARTAELCRAGRPFARVANWLTGRAWFREVLDAWLGIDRRAPLPTFARRTFREWLAGASLPVREVAGAPVAEGTRRVRPRHEAGGASGDTSRSPVALFVDTWTNYFTPEAGIAAVRVLDSMGYAVIVPPGVCCGRPAISKGMLDVAASQGRGATEALGPLARAGIPVVGVEPSCVSALIDELPQLVRTDAARATSARARMIESFLAAEVARLEPVLKRSTGAGLGGTSMRGVGAVPPRLLYHAHCHQKALTGTADAARVLAACFGASAAEIPSGCCGMAGSFGMERAHYDVAAAVGEDRLFDVVRRSGEAEIAVSGFSCRHQIEHHTGRKPLHLVEWLARALGD